MLGQDQFTKAQLCLIAWREGHAYGGHRAMVMIAQCLTNRKKNGWGTWSTIFEQVPMFSALTMDKQPGGYPDLVEPNFIRMLQEIDSIYDGTASDRIDGATYYADLATVNRPWFVEKIIQSPGEHPRTAQLQTLVFFR